MYKNSKLRKKKKGKGVAKYTPCQELECGRIWQYLAMSVTAP